MKKTALAFVLVTGVSATVTAADTRTLNGAHPAESLAAVALDSSIGDVVVEAIDGIDEVRVEVLLTPRRGGFFSSKRRAEQEVQSASLSIKRKGDTLALQITPKTGEDQRFEEDWHIEMPATLAFELDHGVGDVTVQNTADRIEIDSGVGDVKLDVRGGDVAVELGVGTAVVRAPADAYATVESEGGVGDARITVRGEKISGSGFVGHSAKWQGAGNRDMQVSVGVGDAIITLE